MRIKQIKIDEWRHFKNIEFNIPEETTIVCLIGSNGAGKSQILELIGACSHAIGLSNSYESYRQNPLDENSTFRITFHLATNVVSQLDVPELFEQLYRDLYPKWDRTLSISREGNSSLILEAGGLPQGSGVPFAGAITQILRTNNDINYLSLDADRAYPKLSIQPHQMMSSLARNWDATKRESSSKNSRNLYEEWLHYFVGRENKENSRHIEQIRIARIEGKPEPIFIDHFKTYTSSVQKVLPHLIFRGVDSIAGELKFSSTNTTLPFDQLSGGEREIAFLVGQIERFSLKKGLLLVDEPELHLNADLLRSWIAFLRDSVTEGQIWLATHSLETVEVAGQESTFILERDEETRTVKTIKQFSSQPLLGSLARAVGSPAFSISSLSFVFIEGTEEIGELERFRLLTSASNAIRFIDGGSCGEVLRRVKELKAIALASGQNIRIGGIVDRDWRSKREISELESDGIHVLQVHEIENLFLHPESLKELKIMLGSKVEDLVVKLIAAADARAGSWIFDGARTSHYFLDFPTPSKKTREMVHQLSWDQFHDISAQCHDIAKSDQNLQAEQIDKLKEHLIVWAKLYDAKRTAEEIWQVCHGKEVFQSLTAWLGFSSKEACERTIMKMWSDKPSSRPHQLQALINYVNQI